MCRRDLWSCLQFAPFPLSDFASFLLETCHMQFNASITSYSLRLALSNARICILVVGAVGLRTYQRQAKCSYIHPWESRGRLSSRERAYRSLTRHFWRKFTPGDAHDCGRVRGTLPLTATNLRRPFQSWFVMWLVTDYTQSSFESDSTASYFYYYLHQIYWLTGSPRPVACPKWSIGSVYSLLLDSLLFTLFDSWGIWTSWLLLILLRRCP